MSNVNLLWRKPTDGGSYSGGSWYASLPLDNLLTTDLTLVARSTDADPESTRWRIDCDIDPLQPFSMFFMAGHNLTTDAFWEIVLTDDPADADHDARLYTSGLIPVWVPTIVFGSVPWGQFPWHGVDRAAYPAGTYAYHLAPSTVSARYVFVYIADPDNPAGYVQVGRFIGGQASTFGVNAEYGASVRHVDERQRRRLPGGRRLVSKLGARYREISMQFGALTKAEALGVAYEIDRQLGVGGDLLVVFDPEEDGSVRFRRTVYGSLSELGQIAETGIDRFSWSAKIEELT